MVSDASQATAARHVSGPRLSDLIVKLFSAAVIVVVFALVYAEATGMGSIERILELVVRAFIIAGIAAIVAIILFRLIRVILKARSGADHLDE
jgi:Na+/H+-dicarboxylate symporter